eukprot:PhM_4_TR8153/c0_g1_i1/m.26899
MTMITIIIMMTMMMGLAARRSKQNVIRMRRATLSMSVASCRNTSPSTARSATPPSTTRSSRWRTRRACSRPTPPKLKLSCAWSTARRRTSCVPRSRRRRASSRPRSTMLVRAAAKSSRSVTARLLWSVASSRRRSRTSGTTSARAAPAMPSTRSTRSTQTSWHGTLTSRTDCRTRARWRASCTASWTTPRRPGHGCSQNGTVSAPRCATHSPRPCARCTHRLRPPNACAARAWPCWRCSCSTRWSSTSRWLRSRPQRRWRPSKLTCARTAVPRRRRCASRRRKSPPSARRRIVRSPPLRSACPKRTRSTVASWRRGSPRPRRSASSSRQPSEGCESLSVKSATRRVRARPGCSTTSTTLSVPSARCRRPWRGNAASSTKRSATRPWSSRR